METTNIAESHISQFEFNLIKLPWRIFLLEKRNLRSINISKVFHSALN